MKSCTNSCAKQLCYIQPCNTRPIPKHDKRPFFAGYFPRVLAVVARSSRRVLLHNLRPPVRIAYEPRCFYEASICVYDHGFVLTKYNIIVGRFQAQCRNDKTPPFLPFLLLPLSLRVSQFPAASGPKSLAGTLSRAFPLGFVVFSFLDFSFSRSPSAQLILTLFVKSACIKVFWFFDVSDAFVVSLQTKHSPPPPSSRQVLLNETLLVWLRGVYGTISVNTRKTR